MQFSYRSFQRWSALRDCDHQRRSRSLWSNKAASDDKKSHTSEAYVQMPVTTDVSVSTMSARVRQQLDIYDLTLPCTGLLRTDYKSLHDFYNLHDLCRTMIECHFSSMWTSARVVNPTLRQSLKLMRSTSCADARQVNVEM